MRKTVLAVIFVAVSLVGCNRESAKPEPLNALQSSNALIESTYGPDFWHDQYQRSTDSGTKQPATATRPTIVTQKTVKCS